MNKKILIILLSGIFIAGLATFLFFSNNNEGKTISKNLNLIPLDANMIIEINDFHDVIDIANSRASYWDTLTDLDNFSKLNKNLFFLDSISSKSPVFEKLMKNSEIIISFHSIGSLKTGKIIITKIPEEIKEKNIINEIKELSDSEELKNHKYENKIIYSLEKSKIDKNKYSFTILKGNLVLSDNSILIEDAIRQSKTEASILNQKDFTEIYKTAGKKETANIYLNLKRLNHLLSPFFSKDILKKHSFFENYGAWVELDLIPDESLISFNGFANISDSTYSYINHFLNQEASNPGFEKILPENTAVFYSFSADNPDKFLKYRSAYLDKNVSSKHFIKHVNQYKKDYGVDIKDMISSVIKDQVCIAVTNPNSLDVFQNTYLIISIKSASLTKKRLLSFLKKYTENIEQNAGDYKETLKLDNTHSFEVYRMPVNNWSDIFFGSFFKSAEPSFATIIDNKLIFAKSRSSLKKLINNYLLNNTLEKNKLYQEFKKNLSKEHQVQFYCNTQLSIPWISHLLNKKYKDKLIENKNIISNFRQISMQQIISDKMLYHNIAVKYSTFNYNKPHTIWESRLDTSAFFKPAMVINHKTGDKEIFIQDKDNTIYLINSKGHILWKYPLSERIISEIYQVDRYKNNKLQFLFNTKSKIHLIDRLGNYVERYPVPLRSNASCGMGLFDYNNNKNYRILIPTDNKELYMYNIEGNLVEGWNAKPTEYRLNSAPQHFRLEEKDYIVFHDKYKISILNRKGETRVQPNYQFAASENNKFYMESKNPSGIVITDKSGKVMKVYFNGNTDSTNIKEFSSEHFFMYKDINTDGKYDYIFLDNNLLEVYKQDKSLMFKYKFENNISSSPNYYIFSSNSHKLGIIDKKAEKIYLINSNGKLHPGFPLTGLSPFSISFLSDESRNFNLIVAGKNNFLYNYAVK